MSPKLSSLPRSIAQEHSRRVVPFESLYDSVSAEIELFRDNTPSTLTADDRQWLTLLVTGFRSRFDEWIPVETEYLRTLYQQNWSTFTICGHASLHISFDLPLVIASSLRGGMEHEKLLRAEHFERVYVDLEKVFIEAMHAKWERPWLIEALQWRPLEFESVFLTWLLALRREAWFRAKELARSDEDGRVMAETRLHNEVQEKLETALAEVTLWGKIFALSAPRPVPSWAGAALISAIAAGVASLLSVWMAVGIELGLPIVLNLMFKRIAAAELRKVLKSFKPRSDV